MKAFISALSLCLFSLSIEAAEFSCKIPDIEGMKGTTFKVELDLSADKFIGLEDEPLKVQPTREDRLRWNVLEISDLKVYIDARKQTLEVFKADKLEKEVKLECIGVEEAEFEEISILNTPGKLEAMGGYYSESDRIVDDSRSFDATSDFSSEASLNGSSSSK